MEQSREEQATGTGADAGGEESREKSEGLIITLAGRGEEAAKRVYGELSDNPRMQDVKELLDKASHSMLNQLNIATRDEIQALREELARLEERVTALEGGPPKRSPRTQKSATEG